MDEKNAEKDTSTERTSIPGRSWPGAGLYGSGCRPPCQYRFDKASAPREDVSTRKTPQSWHARTRFVSCKVQPFPASMLRNVTLNCLACPFT